MAVDNFRDWFVLRGLPSMEDNPSIVKVVDLDVNG